MVSCAIVTAQPTSTSTHNAHRSPPDAPRSDYPHPTPGSPHGPPTPVSEETDGEPPPDQRGKPTESTGAGQTPAPGPRPTHWFDRPPDPGPRTQVLATASTKGGVGKTTIVVALAGALAARHTDRQIIVYDIDRQDLGSATSWLDATADQLPNLVWANGNPKQLADTEFDPTSIVIVDTPPSTENLRAVVDIARLADLVLIPGSVDEADITVQTARLLDAEAPGIPYAAVFTRSLASTVGSEESQQLVLSMADVEVPIAGHIRQTRAISSARPNGLLPTETTGQAADHAGLDIARLAGWVEEWIAPHAS